MNTELDCIMIDSLGIERATMLHNIIVKIKKSGFPTIITSDYHWQHKEPDIYTVVNHIKAALWQANHMGDRGAYEAESMIIATYWDRTVVITESNFERFLDWLYV